MLASSLELKEFYDLLFWLTCRLWWSLGPFYKGYSWDKNKSLWTFTHFITQTHTSTLVLHLCPEFPPCALDPPLLQTENSDISVPAQLTEIPRPSESRQPEELLAHWWPCVAGPLIAHPSCILSKRHPIFFFFSSESFQESRPQKQKTNQIYFKLIVVF